MLKIPFVPKRSNRRYRLVALEPRPDGFILAGLRGSSDAPELAYFGKFPADNPLQSGEDGFAGQLQPFIDEAGAKGALATTLLNRSEINFILTEAPDVERAEWRDALKWRIRDLIDFPVEQAVIDAFPVAVEPPGEGPQAFVVAARQEKVRNRVRGATEAGLDGLAVGGVALRRTALDAATTSARTSGWPTATWRGSFPSRPRGPAC
ncbi:MAG: hypothetical protein ABEK42_02845 [Thiohalorhabdaceae bacterium]